jgi:hypothetical protein
MIATSRTLSGDKDLERDENDNGNSEKGEI